jgi:8-amino-7-oxononanoate synthase
VNVARPPATPNGMFLLRCSLCAEHSKEQIDTILAAFKSAGQLSGAIPNAQPLAGAALATA